jgi:hypothetical protein
MLYNPDPPWCIPRTDSGHERQEPKRRKQHQMHGPLHHISDSWASNGSVAQTFLSVLLLTQTFLFVLLLTQTGMSVPPIAIVRPVPIGIAL